MKKTVYGETTENFRNIIDVRLVSNENNYLKWRSKQDHMSHKIFDKVTLTINKLAYAGICIFHRGKVLMHKLHCDTLKVNLVTTQDYYSSALMYEIKTEDVHEDFSKDKEIYDLAIIQLSQNIMIIETN